MTNGEPFVMSVRGPIDPASLGQTLMAEHLVADWDLALGRAPHLSSMLVVNQIVDCLAAAHAVGVGTLVDVSPERFGLAPLMLRLVAEQTPVHVVAATGVWKPLALPLPGWVYPPATAEDIAEHFIAAAREGIDRSGVKPGIITVATDAGPTNSIEENVFAGAAIAQRATGLAITTHTTSAACAQAHVEMLGNAGADMDRVVLGRVGLRSGAAGFPLYERMAKFGVSLGIDNFGMIRPDKEWAEMTVRLIESGYTDQIILSHDTTVLRRGMEGIYEKRTLKDKNILGIENIENIAPSPTEGDFTLIHSRLLPLLRQAGIDDDTITRIMVDNPRRILTVDPARYPHAFAGREHETVRAS
jgi:phosphotriesterase-related protein